MGDTNGISEHALGVLTIFPQDASFFAYPEHLNDEEDPLKDEESGNPWGCNGVNCGAHGMTDTLTKENSYL